MALSEGTDGDGIAVNMSIVPGVIVILDWLQLLTLDELDLRSDLDVQNPRFHIF